MCGPAAPILAAAAAVTSAAGTLYAGSAQAAQARYQAKVADRNAQIADAQAADAQDRGRLEAQRYYRQAAQLRGKQNAALAANGIDLGFGSAAQLAEDTVMLQREDAATIAENSAREAQGFTVQAANERSQAVASRSSASAAIVGSYFGAGSTLLSGATQYAKLKRG